MESTQNNNKIEQNNAANYEPKNRRSPSKLMSQVLWRIWYEIMINYHIFDQLILLTADCEFVYLSINPSPVRGAFSNEVN